jgi:hypothetical protein
VTWVDFFATLLAYSQPANSINVGIGQAVTLLASFSMAVTATMTLTVLRTTTPVPNTTLFPNTTLYPG